MASRRRTRPVLATAAVAATLATVPPFSAGALAPTDPVPPSAVPSDAVPVPGGPPATNPDGTPATVLPDPLASAEGLSSGAYATQPPFDAASLMPVVAEVATHRGVARRAARVRAEAQAEFDAAQTELARVVTRRTAVSAARRVHLSGAIDSKADLRRRAVAAYIRGNQAVNVFATIGNPDDHSRAQQYLQTMAGLDREAFDRYETGIARMDEATIRLIDEEVAATERLDAARRTRDAAAAEHLGTERCLVAAELGARVCVPEFVGPVLGDVAFGNSWGFPRMPGTPDQHWHEGIDIVGPAGREVVAVDDGTLFDVGSNELGGLRLWLRAADGTEYYYAHLAGFAPGAVEGAVVERGAVLAYLGDSGNAAGGVPHLHFEVHPAGGPPVNPYPFVKAAWGNRPQPTDAEALAGPASASPAPLPAEER